MDYVLNVYKGNEFMFAVGGKHMNYDNVIWYELEKLTNVVENYNELNKEELLKNIQSNCEYFTIVMDSEYKDGCSLNITDKTITVDHLQLYDLNEVTFYNCGRELVRVDNDYFVKYEGCDELFDVDYINYDLELLQKKLLTFDEFKEISSLVNGLIDDNKFDVIVNDSKFLLLTEI